MWCLSNHPPVFLSFSARRLERRGFVQPVFSVCATGCIACTAAGARARAVASSLLFDPTSQQTRCVFLLSSAAGGRSDFFFFSSAFASAERAADPNNASRKKESLLLLTFQTRIDTFFFVMPVIYYQACNPLKFSAGMIFPFWLCKRVFL